MRLYNEVRPHQTLAYMAPTRFEELYGKKRRGIYKKPVSKSGTIMYIFG